MAPSIHMGKPSNLLILLAVVVAALLACGLWESLSVEEVDDGPAVAPESFMPTPHDVVDRMLELAELGPDDLLYDLGSGDGRIVIAAGQDYGSRAIGFEIDDALVALSRANVTNAGVAERVRIDQADIFTLDLAEPDVVTLYLSEELNAQLVPQLLAMKPGALIISHDFMLPNYSPDKMLQVTPRGDAGAQHTLYLWTTPLGEGAGTTEVLVPSQEARNNFAPTPMPVVDEMIRLANLMPGQMLYDLGSGDGRILVAAAQAAEGVQATGYEIDDGLIAMSRQKAAEAGLQNQVTVLADNLFSVDLSEADVVTLYLSEAMNKRLVPQLLTMKPGARIVSHQYDLPGIKPQAVVNMPPLPGDLSDHMLYMWETPLEPAED
jgi:cyclopropane fatty-acyl-phospholipid synthase-like methyltransferase